MGRAVWTKCPSTGIADKSGATNAAVVVVTVIGVSQDRFSIIKFGLENFKDHIDSPKSANGALQLLTSSLYWVLVTVPWNLATRHSLVLAVDIRSCLIYPVSAATMFVPAVPCTIFSMSSSEPMAARLPVASTNLTAAATLGPMEPAAKLCSFTSAGVARCTRRCSGLPQSR